MPEITFAEIAAHDPDRMLPPEDEFAAEYWDRVAYGREQAAKSRVALVAICRNAMPWLTLTMPRVEKTASLFKDWKCFIFENDSVDGTKDYLSEASKACDRLTVEMHDNGRPHLNSTKTSDRTIALAEYRNACRLWAAKHCEDFDYAIVFDTDPWGGWSVDGIANTIGHLEDYENAIGGWHTDWHSAAGMGSYSWCIWGPPVWPRPMECQYDAWAARWTWWRERYQMLWFHSWLPPVGSPPVRMNSCFGQLGTYRMRNFIKGVYEGGDCEHVAHWKTCGGDCYLNPSQRVVSFWIPEGGGEQEQE